MPNPRVVDLPHNILERFAGKFANAVTTLRDVAQTHGENVRSAKEKKKLLSMLNPAGTTPNPTETAESRLAAAVARHPNPTQSPFNTKAYETAAKSLDSTTADTLNKLDIAINRMNQELQLKVDGLDALLLDYEELKKHDDPISKEKLAKLEAALGKTPQDIQDLIQDIPVLKRHVKTVTDPNASQTDRLLAKVDIDVIGARHKITKEIATLSNLQIELSDNKNTLDENKNPAINQTVLAKAENALGKSKQYFDSKQSLKIHGELNLDVLDQYCTTLANDPQAENLGVYKALQEQFATVEKIRSEVQAIESKMVDKTTRALYANDLNLAAKRLEEAMSVLANNMEQNTPVFTNANDDLKKLWRQTWELDQSILAFTKSQSLKARAGRAAARATSGAFSPLPQFESARSLVPDIYKDDTKVVNGAKQGEFYSAFRYKLNDKTHRLEKVPITFVNPITGKDEPIRPTEAELRQVCGEFGVQLKFGFKGDYTIFCVDKNGVDRTNAIEKRLIELNTNRLSASVSATTTAQTPPPPPNPTGTTGNSHTTTNPTTTVPTGPQVLPPAPPAPLAPPVVLPPVPNHPLVQPPLSPPPEQTSSDEPGPRPFGTGDRAETGSSTSIDFFTTPEEDTAAADGLAHDEENHIVEPPEVRIYASPA